MAKVKSTATLEVQVIVSLTEPEAEALQWLVSYGTDKLVEFLYDKKTADAKKLYWKGVESMVNTLDIELPKQLSRGIAARKAFEEVG